MNNTDLYPYVMHDLLENPNTYKFSAYHGISLLNAWANQRSVMLHNIPANNATTEIQQNSSKTDSLLNHLLESMKNNHDLSSTTITLNNLVKRFEVSKRLHGEYNEHWKPINPDDYKSYSTYITFSELLELAYTTTSSLPFLNCLLKVLDTIASFKHKLKPDECRRIEHIISREAHHVNMLRNKLEIPQHDT